MRNLKRVLSLALATVMLLGMMVIGTGAADINDFTDSSQIKNEEAVAVTTAIGIFKGYGDGSFRPNEIVNRAEMAAIMIKLLYGDIDTSGYKGKGPFNDVVGTDYEWADGYINMCYNMGLLSGTGANTYSPGDPITTYQADLLLQRALGWWKVGAYDYNAGIDDLSVATKAQQLGMNGSLALSLDAGLTRDNVAELVLNTIAYTAPVEYNSMFQTYYTAGKTWTNGLEFEGNDTLAYKNFGLIGTVSEDELGRPGQKWSFGTYTKTQDGKNLVANIGSEITVTPVEPILVYTSKQEQADVDRDLKGYTVSNVDTTINGKDSADTTDGTALKTLTGNGKVVEVYAGTTTISGGVLTEHPSNVVTKIVVTETQAVVIDRVNTRTGAVTLKLGNNTTKTVDKDSKFYKVVDGLEKDTVLATIIDASGVMRDLWVPTAVTGKVTRFNDDAVSSSKDYAVINGQQMYLGNVFDGKGLDATKVGSNVVVYLDDYGYVLYADSADTAPAPAAPEYIYVTNIWQTKTAAEYGKPAGVATWARGVKADGTVATLEIANALNTYDSGTKANSVADNAAIQGYNKAPNDPYKYGIDPGDAYILGDKAADGAISKVVTAIGSSAEHTYTAFITDDKNGQGQITNSRGFVARYVSGARGVCLLVKPDVADVRADSASAGAVTVNNVAMATTNRRWGSQSTGAYLSTDLQVVYVNYKSNADDKLSATVQAGPQNIDTGTYVTAIMTGGVNETKVVSTVFVAAPYQPTVESHLYYVAKTPTTKTVFTDGKGEVKSNGWVTEMYLDGDLVDDAIVTQNTAPTPGFYTGTAEGEALKLTAVADGDKATMGVYVEGQNVTGLYNGLITATKSITIDNAIIVNLTDEGALSTEEGIIRSLAAGDTVTVSIQSKTVNGTETAVAVYVVDFDLYVEPETFEVSTDLSTLAANDLLVITVGETTKTCVLDDAIATALATEKNLGNNIKIKYENSKLIVTVPGGTDSITVKYKTATQVTGAPAAGTGTAGDPGATGATTTYTIPNTDLSATNKYILVDGTLKEFDTDLETTVGIASDAVAGATVTYTATTIVVTTSDTTDIDVGTAKQLGVDIYTYGALDTATAAKAAG